MARPVPLPLAASPLIPCTRCAKCCTYVAVGINAPHSLRYASDVLWYLYHDGVSVHREAGGEWMVVFETRCRHLGDDLLCGIYEHRPPICREFDNTTCEVNAPAGGRTFTEPAEFLDWLRSSRPALYRRLARRFVPPARPAEPARRGAAR